MKLQVLSLYALLVGTGMAMTIDDIEHLSLHHREPASVEPPADKLAVRQSYIGQGCTNTAHGNIPGTCQYTSYCSSHGGTADPNPDCPGPDNVQCCIFDDCINGASGICLDTRSWNCRELGGSGFDSGNFCPGPQWYQCCRGI